MTAPKQREIYRPALEYAQEIGRPFTVKELKLALRQRMNLSEDDLAEVTKGGTPRFYKNVEYVDWKLKQAGMLRSTSGGKEITDEGRKIVGQPDVDIQNEVTKRARTDNTDPMLNDDAALVDVLEAAPEDVMAASDVELRNQLADELIGRVLDGSPTGFEKLTLKLLKGMGYGEPYHTGRSGDGGIDGIMHVDHLGLEKIYVQAKRYAIGTNVREPEIRNFSASLEAQGATKGVFITTSNFNPDARHAAEAISAGNKFIRLVHGDELAQLMIIHGVGVVTEYTFEIKRIDETFFADEV